MTKILVLHGPNLNLLGTREPEIYGITTLTEINRQLEERAASVGIQVDIFQSNSEGDAINWLQERRSSGLGVIINLAAWTHSSIALRDTLVALDIPIIEVHISNIFKREDFRRNSLFSEIAVGLISGLGPQGYFYAFDFLISHLNLAANTGAH